MVRDQFYNSMTEKDGVWFLEGPSMVSYPENGNNECFFIEENSYWFLHRNKILIEKITCLSNGKEFFDIGGGNGFVSKDLLNNGFEVCLIEPGLEGILNAKRRGIFNLINSSFENLKTKPKSIDNVGIFDVIEHIENDKSFLDSINNSLRKNGRLFITVPAYKFLWSNADIHAGHFRRYSQKSLSALVETSGFQVVYSTYFFSFLVPLIFIFRTIPGWFLKNRRINTETEHNSKSSLVNFLIKKLCSYELNRIKKGKRVFFGSSLLLVANKIN